MNNPKSRNLLPTLLLATILMAPLTGCGGGGGGGTAPSSTAANGSLSGTAVKGPVHGGTVSAYAIANGAMGNRIGQATTDSQGHFQIDIGDYSGPAMIQITGGNYTDEATGTTMPLAAGEMMTAVIPMLEPGTAMTGIEVTPLTSMAEAMAGSLAGGMTTTNITAANRAVGGYFMVDDILHTPPLNPLQDGAGSTATQSMANYGMTLAAISQEAHTLGMGSSSDLVAAMMNDATDGSLNGMMGSTSISMGGGMMGGNSTMSPSAATSDLAAAMSDFMGSVQNRSGLTVADMQALMDRLATANGTL